MRKKSPVLKTRNSQDGGEGTSINWDVSQEKRTWPLLNSEVAAFQGNVSISLFSSTQ